MVQSAANQSPSTAKTVDTHTAVDARRLTRVFRCLIGSIHQYHQEVGAGVNKAIHILCVTEGNDKQRMSAFRQRGLPGVYESSLKKAWTKFRPVAHLCGAYVTTETHYYQDQLSRDFGEYWKQPPAFYDDRVFQHFCLDLPRETSMSEVENSAWRSRFGWSGRRFVTSIDSSNDLKQSARLVFV
jgi:hypothetical protein